MMICRRMLHVVYRSNGAVGAALGAANKNDLTAPENRGQPFRTKEAAHLEMTDAWSRRCGMCFVRAFRGRTFHSVLDREVPSIVVSDDVRERIGGDVEKQNVDVLLRL